MCRCGLGVLISLLSLGCVRSDLGGGPAEGLLVTPGVLRFAVRPGRPSAAQEVVVSDADGAGGRWRAAAGARWLVLDREVGPLPGVLRVDVDPTALAGGTYTAVVRFTAGERLAQLLVELTVETPGWTALGGPHAGPVTALGVSPDDPNRVLAGVGRGAAIWASDDGGESFRYEALELSWHDWPSSLVLLPGGRVYLSVYRDHPEGTGGVYRSDDAGASWAAVGLANRSVEALVATAAAPERLLVLSDGALLHSADGGSAFAPVTTSAPASMLAVDPRSGGAFVGLEDGTLCSTADGTSLTCGATPTGYRLQSLHRLADGRWWLFAWQWEGEAVMTSIDATSWEVVRPAGLPHHDGTEWIGFACDGARLWTLGSELLVSEDEGGSFAPLQRARRGMVDRPSLEAAVAHPGGTLLAGNGEGVLRHVDGVGLVPMQLTAHTISSLELHAANGQLVGAAYVAGVFRWRASVGFEGLGGAGLLSAMVWTLSVDQGDSQRMMLGLAGSGDHLLTNDGGLSWTSTQPGLPYEASVTAIARSPDVPGLMWAAADYDGFYVSRDGGLTFSTVTSDQVTGVVAIGGERALVARGGTQIVDAATGTWTEVHYNCCSQDGVARTVDGSLWYFNGYDGLHRSRDDGASFAEVLPGGIEPWAIAVDPFDSTHLFFADGGVLRESRDDGVSWSDAGAPFPATTLLADPLSGALFVGTDGGGLYRYSPP